MALSFFVVGDIGEHGPARCQVAGAISSMLQSGDVCAAFVISVGDNFYSCKSKQHFAESFAQLQEDMLNKVPLPWYFTLGNHDIKSVGGDLHVEHWHGIHHPKGWQFRCPSTFYNVAEDYQSLEQPSVPWDASLLDINILNTNKVKAPLNFLGLSPGVLHATKSTWDDEKTWLKNRLAASAAAWKIVIGHHPIEFIPHSFKEHGIPGVSFLTSGFMKGHTLSKKRGTGMRDVVVQGGADVYLAGHQHIMAHLVRGSQKDRSNWRGGGPGVGNCEYWIVGSSS